MTSQLQEVKKNTIIMAKARGYTTVADDAILDMTPEEFNEYAQEKARETKNVRGSLSVIYSNAKGEKFLVYFGSKQPSQKQIPIEVGTRFIESATRRGSGIKEAILVINAPLSSKCRLEIEKLTSVRWQVFDDKDLTYNPTEHIDNPKFVVLTPEEARAKLVELKVSGLSGCPFIKVYDPIAKYYGWQVGTMVKIIRNDSAHGVLDTVSINYRVVVN